RRPFSVKPRFRLRASIHHHSRVCPSVFQRKRDRVSETEPDTLHQGGLSAGFDGSRIAGAFPHAGRALPFARSSHRVRSDGAGRANTDGEYRVWTRGQAVDAGCEKAESDVEAQAD